MDEGFKYEVYGVISIYVLGKQVNWRPHQFNFAIIARTINAVKCLHTEMIGKSLLSLLRVFEY